MTSSSLSPTYTVFHGETFIAHFQDHTAAFASIPADYLLFSSEKSSADPQPIIDPYWLIEKTGDRLQSRSCFVFQVADNLATPCYNRFLLLHNHHHQLTQSRFAEVRTRIPAEYYTAHDWGLLDDPAAAQRREEGFDSSYQEHYEIRWCFLNQEQRLEQRSFVYFGKWL